MAYKHITRPLKIKSVEEVNEKIEAYFDNCDEKRKPYTVLGLCYALDVCRDTFLYYMDKKHLTSGTGTSMSEEVANGISDSLQRARSRIAAYTEEQLFSKQGVTGARFVLCNNFGYAEKVEVTTKHSDSLENLTDEELEELAKKLK